MLDDLEEQQRHGDEYQKKYAIRKLDTLLRHLQRDGLAWSNGKIIQAGQAGHLGEMREAVQSLDASKLLRQLVGLRESVDDDPGLAIGTAKEMLETTCKTILEDAEIQVRAEWDTPGIGVAFLPLTGGIDQACQGHCCVQAVPAVQPLRSVQID